MSNTKYVKVLMQPAPNWFIYSIGSVRYAPCAVCGGHAVRVGSVNLCNSTALSHLKDT